MPLKLGWYILVCKKLDPGKKVVCLNADFVATELLFGFGRHDVMPRPLKVSDAHSVSILESGTMKLQSLLQE